MNELELQAQIRLALGARKDCVFWRNSVGVGTNQSGNKVTFGLGRGSSDLVGLLRPSGRWVALEIKAGKGKVSEDQEKFIKLINLGGGFARVVRNVEEAMAAVDLAQSTADRWIGKTFSALDTGLAEMKAAKDAGAEFPVLDLSKYRSLL